MPRKNTFSSDQETLSPPQGWPAELVPFLSFAEGPGTDPFYCISGQGLSQTAALNGSSIRDAMLFSLSFGIWPARFKNNRGTFSAEKQASLLRSRAVIIGCGGLGGYVALFLARAGIGSLCLCDHDSFDESNLNRQAFCREDRIGMNKALAGCGDLALVASHVRVDVFTQKADAGSLPEILAGAHIVVDCLDDISTRRLVEKAAHESGIPFVHGAIAGYEVFALASMPGVSAISRLYGERELAEPASAECRLGVPTPTPAGAAVLQSMLVLRLLTGEALDPSNVMWHMDLAIPELETLYF